MITNLLFASGALLVVLAIGGYLALVAGSVPPEEPGENK
jgi:hypothetical protein